MTKTFKSYGLSKEILKAMTLLGFDEPTPVQQAVLPLALEGKDLYVKSPTGSGKTAAFAIPICEKVDWQELRPQALIISPTRELAMQIKEDCFYIGRLKRIKVVTLYGKASFIRQEQELKQKTHLVVGTPGRILDHLTRGTFKVENIQYLVIDEADEMLKMGFMEQIIRIVEALPRQRQTLLFSATLKPDIDVFCKQYMNQAKQVCIEHLTSTLPAIDEVGYYTHVNDKLNLLMHVTKLENPQACIIFCNTRQRVEYVNKALYEAGYPCEAIHGDKEQEDRFKVMKDFRDGKFRYLVSTDVAARGIDIDHIDYVVNFDVPEHRESYVHRIGRTGRAGRKGKAITLISPSEQDNLQMIEDYIERKISILEIPQVENIAYLEQQFKEKIQQRVIVGESKGEKLGVGIMKLHINAGKKTKMRPVDIVGTLCNLPGISAQDIGIIVIQDISTFVEIMNDKGEMVYQMLQTTPIKGRMRRVSKVE